jgi:hypothetical protein
MQEIDMLIMMIMMIIETALLMNFEHLLTSKFSHRMFEGSSTGKAFNLYSSLNRYSFGIVLQHLNRLIDFKVSFALSFSSIVSNIT